MKIIESLTDSQIAKFAEFTDRWTKIGLSTAPADRPRAEEAIHLMYKWAGLATAEKNRMVWITCVPGDCLRNYRR